MHTRVYTQPDIHRLGYIGTEDRFFLRLVFHQQPEAFQGRNTDFIGTKSTFKQQNRLANTRLAKFQGLLNTGNTKSRGYIGQSLCHFQHTVAIGIGLDHGHGFRVRCQGLGQGEVMSQCLQVDGCPGWS